MKKLATFVFALLLGASLSFAQAGGTKGTGAPSDSGKPTDTKKKGGKKGHKGGKKGKKTTHDNTPAPK